MEGKTVMHQFKYYNMQIEHIISTYDRISQTISLSAKELPLS